MRNVSSGLYITVDGVIESPNEWQFDAFDEELGAAMGEGLTDVDTLILGRVTYVEWASYWPHSTEEPYASFINTTPKVVVSRTLEEVAWATFDTASLLEGDLTEGIHTLKAQSGKTISVLGSPTLVRSLLANDLLDELTLMVFPVIAGKGKRLFESDMSLKRLELTASKTTRKGVSILTYRPRRA